MAAAPFQQIRDALLGDRVATTNRGKHLCTPVGKRLNRPDRRCGDRHPSSVCRDDGWIDRQEGDEPQEWYVLDPSGVWLGVVGMPARFELMRVGADEVLGVRRDVNDVEHPQVLRLVKP